jgi:hypothetical protein
MQEVGNHFDSSNDELKFNVHDIVDDDLMHA